MPVNVRVNRSPEIHVAIYKVICLASSNALAQQPAPSHHCLKSLPSLQIKWFNPSFDVAYIMLLKLSAISAGDLSPRSGSSFGQPPNCRVKIIIDGTSYKTKVVKRTLNPSFNEVFSISIADLSTLVTVQLWHDSSVPFNDHLLGEASIEFAKVLEKSSSQDGKETRLALSRVVKGSSKPVTTGYVMISVPQLIPDTVAAATAALDAAQQSLTSGDVRGGPLQTLDPIDSSFVTDIFGDGARLLQILIIKLDVFVGLVDEASKIHPIASLAWNVVSSVFKAVKGQFDRDAKIVDLLTTVNDVYSFLETIENMRDLSGPLESNVDLALKQTIECALFIQEYCKVGFTGRAVRQTFDAMAAKKIDSFVGIFKALHASITTGVAVQATLVSYRIMDRVDILVREQTLRKLNAVEMDASNRPSCLPKTRVRLLQDICGWATTPTVEAQNIFWLNGLAGSGKSTVATTIANVFRDLRRLGAFTFFDRGAPERSSPAGVIRTLAAQLAAFDPRIGHAITQAIDNIPSIGESPLSLQFTELLVRPLSTMESLSSEGPVVVILDALDECGTAVTREQLLTVLAEQSALLPAFLRIIITSRNEVDILDALEPCRNVHPQELDILTSSNEVDISAFIQDRLRMIRTKRKNRALCLPPDWPGEEAIHSLVQRAAGLFIWASTASAFIDAHDPRARVHTLLQGDIASGAELALDNLYLTALRAAGDWGDPDFVASFQDIVGTVIASMEPLTTEIVDELLGLPRTTPAIHTVERLGCVLSWGPAQPIRTLHPSFHDFLVNHGRCERQEWFINLSVHHRRLTFKCLDHLEQHLKHNIANLTLEKNAVLPQLPGSVSYACAFWIDHICSISDDFEEIRKRLTGFLSTHFLHWLEAMSVMGKSRSTIPLLKKLLEWTQERLSRSPNAEAFIVEATRFVQGAVDLMEEHPLLVYYGALPYVPADTLLYKTFWQEDIFPRVDGRRRHWPAMLQVLSGHGRQVMSVATCTDGTRIASASLTDRAIRIWDAGSGAEVMAALRVSDSIPFSVAMSPDGTSLLAGYADGFVRIWDLTTRTVVLTRHLPTRPSRSRVHTVALTPSGVRFLGTSGKYWAGDYDDDDDDDDDGSDSWVIAVWEKSSPEELILRGHAGTVWTAVFTHDGTRIVSGSDDTDVIVWDATSGIILAKFCQIKYGEEGFTAIPSSVVCVAISPDDQRVLAADDRGRVRLWDIPAGKLLSSPIDDIDGPNGLLRPIVASSPNAPTPVLFSPDGASFLTARRKMIQVWNTADMSIVAEFHGHFDNVTSLSFTHETARIVSGSEDGTVRIWNANSNEGLPSEANLADKDYHMHLIHLSPDDKYIIYVPDLTTVSVHGVYDDLRLSYTGHRDHQREDAWSKSPIVSIACSTDGVLTASASSDNLICVWRTLTGVDVLPPIQHPDSNGEEHQYHDYFFAVAFSADATRLVSGSNETIRVWELSSGNELFVFPRDPASLLETLFPPEGLTVKRPTGPDEDALDTKWEPWDETWARSCLVNPEVDIPSVTPCPLVLDNGWISRRSTGQILSKLPFSLSVKRWVSSESFIAFTTHQTELFVMHFPPVMLEA